MEYISTQAKKGSNTNGQLNGFLVRIIVAISIAVGPTAQKSVESTKKTRARVRISPIFVRAAIFIPFP